MDISTLQPQAIWGNFNSINAIPRASKHEQRIIDFMLSFGKSLDLETLRDETGNVVIRKQASPGYEDKETVVLQSHLDMVHQKNNDTIFDFDKDGIRMYVDGDWVKADGTTLGADNGIGVATIMGILAADNIEHPALEALFTIDEETGMTGAKYLSADLLQGRLLLNLDTEQDNEITIGCAGGVDITARGTYATEPIDQHYVSLYLEVKGLRGGHSGMDIHKGFGNANKILVRVLYDLFQNTRVRLQTIDGGGLRNAIPREAKALLACPLTEIQKAEEVIAWITDEIRNEFHSIEPHLEIAFHVEELLAIDTALQADFQQRLIEALYAVFNGVFRMSPAIPDLVETSNNVARVIVQEGNYEVMCLSRSSVESSKRNLSHVIKSVFDLLGAEVEFSGDYPGWEPEADGELVHIVKESYQRLFNEDPHVNACHAGLECGLIGEKFENMKMVSIGPTILGAHSPVERVSISSVQKFWVFLLDILKNTP